MVFLQFNNKRGLKPLWTIFEFGYYEWVDKLPVHHVYPEMQSRIFKRESVIKQFVIVAFYTHYTNA